jgi:transposase
MINDIMTYSMDLRKRVVGFVNEGGSKTKASRRFEVSLWCVNDWCKREDLAPKVQSLRHRKIDKEALRRHVRLYPDALLRERAEVFGVHINAVWSMMRKMELTHKKSDALQREKP